jgi:exonuclease SbcC
MHAEVAALESGPVAALRSATARAAARARLEAPADDLPAEELIAAAAALRERALAAAAAHDAAGESAEREEREEIARLSSLGEDLGVGGPEDGGAAQRRGERARDECRERVAALDRAAAGARRLRAEAGAARAEARLHQQVAADLRANAFPRFLLARYRERLAVGASARLQELTAGAYRFCGTEPDPMAVVDMRRGERLRPVSSLSGGERFLASLALALGLSDVATESGGRLDCLFLDEGFSSLDAESLEQALAGVERLAGDGRLVGVITHLPGVAERLGAAIHVRKDPGGASHIEDAQPHDGTVTADDAGMLAA